MKVNEGLWDRIVRVILGIVLGYFGFFSMGGTGGIILGIVGLILLVTGIVGFCPAYRLLGISTHKESS